jgi:type VI secretion system protein ImpL
MRFLPQHINIILLALAALVMLALLALVISAARSESGKGGTASAKALRLLGATALRHSFRRAVKLIERNLATRAERYNLSWTMLLNESGGAPLPLPASGLQSALSEEAGMRAAAEGLDWQFFDQGVVIQLRSAYLGGADADADGVWDDLIGLCRKYRPQRPLDCIVLAIPASQLTGAGPDGLLPLVARAKSLHRRLWLAQNRLALRFPIHVVISECETIPGFASFAAALPDATQRSILGWASPYELVAPYRAQWIDSAIDQVKGAVADSCAELCALESGDSDSSAYFLLPGEVERLRAGLTVFCDELMRPSAYHESFLLRGVYLTGDCGDAAVLRAATGGAVVLVDQEDGAAVPESNHAMPAFLRDIFERKIFAEVGLVRASVQRLRQPALKRLGWALMFLAPLLWAVGLAFATVELHRHAKPLIALLASEDGATSLAGGPQATATAALEQFAALGGARFRSVFMPGSWPAFDDLQERVDKRLQKRFAIAAVPALHSAALSQLAGLTGTAYVTGAGGLPLFDPDSCTLAPAPVGAASLDPATLPEFRALKDYVDKLDPLAQAINSIERLEQAEPVSARSSLPVAKGDDLARAVKLLFGHRLADLPNRSDALDRTAALYRQAALSTAGKRTPMPPLDPLKKAARCALQQFGTNLYGHLFDLNPLLDKQRSIAASIASLQESAGPRADLDVQLALWRRLRMALEAQQNLMAPGQGEWMAQRQMQLGTAHADLLKRVENNPLLGPDARSQLATLAEHGYARFTQAWSTASNSASQSDAASSLAWSDDTKTWTATPERKALREAVTALLIQPYVKGSTMVPFPPVPQGAAIIWDKGQLERVYSLIESRKAFRSGPLIDLPVTLQQSASALVDLALLSAAQAALAQGMKVVDAELPDKANDADRARVLELRAWLESIGARGELAPLDAALNTDAVTRLQRLDKVLGAAQLFVPRDAGFDNWTGKAGPLADAFGGGDGTGVLAYVEHQKEFIDAIARQGDGVLKFLVSAGVNMPLVDRWQRQAADLQLYNRKSPLSSRLALETFIVDDGATIDGANCADKLAGRKASLGTDVYAAQLQGLKSALLARCRALSGGENERSWQKFAVAYNRDLGRRPPFVGPGSGAGAAPDAMPAERDAVGTALRNYDLAHAASVHAARDGGQGGARTDVKTAEKDFGRVRDLLAPLFPPDESQPAALDLSIDFRVNRSAEQRANTIIDWSVAVGPATLRQGEPARALRWEPGMPVVLSLRLARDGSVAPDPRTDARRPNMAVVERTVSFRFDDAWALFTFVQTFRVADPAGDDGRAPLLRVDFPVVAAGAPVPLAPQSTVQLFLRARVRAPGKQTTLPWPAAFPEQLPLWTHPAKENSP